MKKNQGKNMSVDEHNRLLSILRRRFENNTNRHKGIEWKRVMARLESHPEKLWSLNQMEMSGGEPDVVEFDKKSGTVTFFDCSEESPKGRRSLCYDEEALASRKENKPKGSVMGQAERMGIEILDEEQYRLLQQLGEFDLKTSSWVKTPDAIRKLGGALFCDRRFDHVFLYHNGAESYYAARAFRGALKV
jgi:hypothetical protein